MSSRTRLPRSLSGHSMRTSSPKTSTFERRFRFLSYSAVFCGFLALWISGSFAIIATVAFTGVMAFAWMLEDTRFQISERVGTSLIVLAIPVYYLLAQYRFFDLSSEQSALPALLARMILSLTAIKLLQRKSDRDWIFLYLMSFFQLLLAAGLSISVGYLLAFALFVFVMASTIVVFEIRKTQRIVEERSTAMSSSNEISIGMRRLVVVAGSLVVSITIFALPMFFMLPRVGGAGLGGNVSGISTFSGFSDSVRLGRIGTIQQNDAIVMRVRLENAAPRWIRWRGIALDTFDGQAWSRTRAALREPKPRNDRDLIQVDLARSQAGLTLQTVYLEPIDTPIIFGLTRIVGVQGNFPMLYRDVHGAITFPRSGERVSYKVLSDTASPSDDLLRGDRAAYTLEFANYLQIPDDLDPRIAELANRVTAGANNRYDEARAIESFLQNDYGYTLEMKAGGSDPLADFLFNVREGHCEYFATAMAVMLRSKGIAARVVNGFQQGEYNETADVYVVRQRNAHSWVEVYFPESDSWVEFDPTPFAGQNLGPATAGISETFRRYVDALETFWIQYFVAFDNQEQRSLFTSLRRLISEYQAGIASGWDVLQADLVDWWRQVRGDEGIESSLAALGRAAFWAAGLLTALLLFVWGYRKAVTLKVWLRIQDRFFRKRQGSIVEFYDRMVRILAGKGLMREPHQTPIEFASAVGMQEAIWVTDKYNRVRFGEKYLTRTEYAQIDQWLHEIETADGRR